MELIISSYLVDLLFGDPRWFPHPVKAMGKAIDFLDARLRSGRGKRDQRLKGVLLTVSVSGSFSLAVYFLLLVSQGISPLLGKIVWVLLAYMTLSIRDLIVHARRVLKSLNNQDLEQARERLALIVGRDTKQLPREKIVTAVIESIAESANDGIVAPLFYLFIGGPVLAFFYKAVNTLDSMVGYKNEKYLHFGWFSARLDDVMNFIPSRITGVLIMIAGFILGKNGINGFKTMVSDGRKHLSPNSGVSEAAMAGVLGLRLGGPCLYKGKLRRNPYIGQAKRETDPVLIQQALVIAFLVSFLMVSSGVVLLWII